MLCLEGIFVCVCHLKVNQRTKLCLSFHEQRCFSQHPIHVYYLHAVQLMISRQPFIMNTLIRTVFILQSRCFYFLSKWVSAILQKRMKGWISKMEDGCISLQRAGLTKYLQAALLCHTCSHPSSFSGLTFSQLQRLVPSRDERQAD